MTDTTLVRELGNVQLIRHGDGREEWVARIDHTPSPSDPPSPNPSPLQPSDPVFGTIPWPEWLSGFRDHQVDAALEVVELFERGKKVVWLDAPTGAGKTVIAEMVRRLMGARALYVCSTKSLQEQFIRDFTYAKVLKGRANYPTLDHPFPDTTCADCTKSGVDDGCSWCWQTEQCPYQVAKGGAAMAEVAVLNTSYLLAEANGSQDGRFSGRGLGVLDECDVLERELMSYVQFDVGYRMLQKLKLKEPKKGSHWATVVQWIEGELRPAVVKEMKAIGGQVTLDLGGENVDLARVRARKQMAGMLRDIDRVLKNVELEADNPNDAGEVAGWVRDNNAGPLTLKPVMVDGYGERVLWRHAEKWLCMSGSIVSAESLSRDLGVADGDWGVVTVPMTFRKANRRIVQIPVANMVSKEREAEWPKMCQGVERVCTLWHKDDRVLVHAVSYDLMNAIAAYLERETDRVVVTYQNAGQRDDAMVRFRSTPAAVLVAPSMDRGVDFKDEDCRAVIVAKVPYPYLGDVQVSRRMRVKGGEVWYRVQTVRTIVQMTGRGVRSEDDYAISYILDRQFATNVMKRSSRLLPRWWVAALEVKRPRELGM